MTTRTRKIGDSSGARCTHGVLPWQLGSAQSIKPSRSLSMPSEQRSVPVSSLGVTVGVAVEVLVEVPVAVDVLVAVPVAVDVAVLVEVLVVVAVDVGVLVEVVVAVLVGVPVGVDIGVPVGVAVAIDATVAVGVLVGPGGPDCAPACPGRRIICTAAPQTDVSSTAAISTDDVLARPRSFAGGWRVLIASNQRSDVRYRSGRHESTTEGIRPTGRRRHDTRRARSDRHRRA